MVVIFGLGFTGSRVARRLLQRGEKVVAAVRDPARFAALIALGMKAVRVDFNSPVSDELSSQFPSGAALLHSVPPLPPAENENLHRLIEAISPRRVVYISATGVYGDQIDVSETTPVAPADSRGMARIEEERWLQSHDWSTLILRSAALYGPGRGVHVSIRDGRLPRGAASGIVSRIHVDDLAALCDAGLNSPLTGAWPVADDQPATTAEIVSWLERRGEPVAPAPVRTEFPVHGRKVDGTAIRAELGVKIQYPSWRIGIEASIAEEGRTEERQSESGSV